MNLPPGDDLVVVRSKKRTTKKKTPALSKKPADAEAAPAASAVPVAAVSPPATAVVAPVIPPPVASTGLLSSLLKGRGGGEEPQRAALSSLLASGMEGEEDEEAVAPPHVAESSSEDEKPSNANVATSDTTVATATGPAAPGNELRGSWTVALKTAWNSTSSRLTSLVQRSSDKEKEVVAAAAVPAAIAEAPEERLAPSQSQREADLREANYLLRTTVLSTVSEVHCAANHNAALLRDMISRHLTSANQCHADAAASNKNAARLTAELDALKLFSLHSDYSKLEEAHLVVQL
jgi:hypothetical protein